MFLLYKGIVLQKVLQAVMPWTYVPENSGGIMDRETTLRQLTDAKTEWDTSEGHACVGAKEVRSIREKADLDFETILAHIFGEDKVTFYPQANGTIVVIPEDEEALQLLAGDDGVIQLP